jgi:2-C-methyl-D-erythritol 4-phosphate cytidylyltransferase
MKPVEKQRKVIAIIPAAGLGKRFGPDTNKPFLPLGGKPLMLWSLEQLESVADIVEIIPVLQLKDMEHGKKTFEEYGIKKIKKIAPGGRERQDSVRNGLRLIEDKGCMVLIHDAARPLIEKNLIINAIHELTNLTFPPLLKGGGGACNGYDGIILGVPLKDTIKEAIDKIVHKTLKRDKLWAIQTPQLFHFRSISKAYEKASEEGYYATDDSALVERYGGKIKIVMGSYKNIKITTPEDLFIAEALLKINERLSRGI